MKRIFRANYTIATLAIFLIEALIALYVRDAFIRPYGGDALAVMLVYVGLRAVTSLRVGPAVAAALAIAFGVEVAQALDLITALGLEDNKLFRTVLGTSFSWGDMAAYAAGAMMVLAIERWRSAMVVGTE